MQDKDTKRTALMEAAQNGHADVVKELIKAKANLNLQDKENHTALTAAISNADVKSVKALVEAGAKLNMPGADALAIARNYKKEGFSFQKEFAAIVQILEDAVKKAGKTP